MRSTTIIAVAALAATVAAADAEPQTQTLYNERGQVTGQATTRGNTTTFSNERGEQTGRAERRGDGTTNFYDSAGRLIGTSRSGSPGR
jgi:YD repeat-containing protein